MTDKKETDKKKAARQSRNIVKWYLGLGAYEQADVQRFGNEWDLIEAKFFISLDLASDEDTRTKYIAHNESIIEQLKRFERINDNKKVFKHVTYEQMEDIYIKGTAKKADITTTVNPSNEGFLKPREFGAVADKFSPIRKEFLEWANQTKTLKVGDIECPAEINFSADSLDVKKVEENLAKFS